MYVLYKIISCIASTASLIGVVHANVGGNWDNSSYCGSRCVNVNDVSANVNANNGCRLASRYCYKAICYRCMLEYSRALSQAGCWTLVIYQNTQRDRFVA